MFEDFLYFTIAAAVIVNASAAAIVGLALLVIWFKKL